jgi:hypothetical protein
VSDEEVIKEIRGLLFGGINGLEYSMKIAFGNGFLIMREEQKQEFLRVMEEQYDRETQYLQKLICDMIKESTMARRDDARERFDKIVKDHTP